MCCSEFGAGALRDPGQVPEDHETSAFKVKKLSCPAPGKHPCVDTLRRCSWGTSGRPGDLCLGLTPPSLIGWSLLPGLGETFLNFTLDVDMMKQRKRLQFLDNRTCGSYHQQWSSGIRLCKPLLLITTEGELYEEDHFSNISVNVSYQLQTSRGHRDHPHPVLDIYNETSTIFQLSYEKACKNKLFCVAELQLATTISQQKLVVGVTKELTMNINLINSGEDSYMTSMALNYPRNLQFKRMQKPPSPNIQCEDPKPTASVLVMTCKIGHPVLKRSSANFSVVWQLEERAFENSTADITVNITNANQRPSLVTETHRLQFRHAFTAVLPKSSVMYVNTSQEVCDHKEFPFNIHGENFFKAKFQLQICVPIKVQGLQLIKVKNLKKTQASTVCTESLRSSCGRNPIQHVEEWHSVSCALTSDKENVTVAVEIAVDQARQFLKDVTELQILGEISFNKSLYEGLNAENHRTKIIAVFLKDEVSLSLPLIIGSSIGGFIVLIVIIIILFKCGFFKRKYQQLNLDSIREAQMKSKNSLTED